jgi:hypothetical protein
MKPIYRFVDYLNFESCFGANAEINVIIPSLSIKKYRDITDRQNLKIDKALPFTINQFSKSKFLVEFISNKPILFKDTNITNLAGTAIFLEKVSKIGKIYSMDRIEEMSDELQGYLSEDYENILVEDFADINIDIGNFFYRTGLHDDDEDTQGILIESSEIMGNEIILEMEILKRYAKGEIRRENYDDYLTNLRELIDNLNNNFELDYVEEYFDTIDSYRIDVEKEIINENKNE